MFYSLTLLRGVGSHGGNTMNAGLFAAIPVEVWGAIIGAVITAVFTLWRGARADAARGLVMTLAEGAWYVAERAGGSGAEKTAKALEALRSALARQGLKSTPKAEALAQAAWSGMSAADGIAADPSEALALR